jgi:hypothetical protein
MDIRWPFTFGPHEQRVRNTVYSAVLQLVHDGKADVEILDQIDYTWIVRVLQNIVEDRLQDEMKTRYGGREEGM